MAFIVMTDLSKILIQFIRMKNMPGVLLFGIGENMYTMQFKMENLEKLQEQLMELQSVHVINNAKKEMVIIKKFFKVLESKKIQIIMDVDNS